MLIVDRSKPGYLIIKEQVWIPAIAALLLGGTTLYLCITAGFIGADKKDWIGAGGCFFFFTLIVLLSNQSIFEFDLTRHKIRRTVRGLMGSTTETFLYSDIKSVAVALSRQFFMDVNPLSGVVLTTKEGRIVPLSKAFYGIYRKGASPPELEKLIQEALNLQPHVVSDEAGYS